MIPASVIVPILVVGFVAGSWSYFLHNPERRVYALHFVLMAGPAALMVLIVVLLIMSSYVAWLSWILFVSAVVLAYFAIQALRKIVVENSAKQRDLERRMMGR
jgi:threonine/homoserine/homoserine lactone efflux protein